MAEFKLSYTASEINNKLGKVDTLVATVNGVAPDASGNVEVASGASSWNDLTDKPSLGLLASKDKVEQSDLAFELPSGTESAGIIDIVELPIENINTGAFYRLMTGTLVYNRYTQETYTVYCVEELPEVGLPATSLDNSEGNVYYNLSDGEAYGYVDDMLSVGIGVPAGWYPGTTLLGALGYEYKGAITSIDDDPCDDSFRLLLVKDFYIYQDGWCKVPFACEKAPAFDIQWDGVIGDRFVIDLSSMASTTSYFVKVSDRVFSAEELIGATYTQNGGYECFITEDEIGDGTMVPGSLVIDGGGIGIVYDATTFNAAIGAPDGYVTNGTYFIYQPDDDSYTNRLIAPAKITKIDEKFLPEMSVDVNSLGLHSVAKSGNYNDLWNRPTIYTDVVRYNTTQNLFETQKSTARTNIDVYSKSEVDTKIANGGSTNLSEYAKTSEVEIMIAEAISGAIGGSY